MRRHVDQELADRCATWRRPARVHLARRTLMVCVSSPLTGPPEFFPGRHAADYHRECVLFSVSAGVESLRAEVLNLPILFDSRPLSRECLGYLHVSSWGMGAPDREHVVSLGIWVAGRGYSRVVPIRPVYYLVCGVVAALVHLILNLGSPIPTIGASGAIAGVMGGFLLLYPRGRIVTLIFIIFFVTTMEVPAALPAGLLVPYSFLAGCLRSAGFALPMPAASPGLRASGISCWYAPSFFLRRPVPPLQL